jgi:hypothetical protein
VEDEENSVKFMRASSKREEEKLSEEFSFDDLLGIYWFYQMICPFEDLWG